MPDDKNPKPTAANPYNVQRPTGLTNLSAKFPKYEGGDARTAKPGTKAPPINGYLLGIVDLPSVIKDKVTGEKKPWKAIIIELKQPAPAVDPDDDTDTVKMYKAGDKIALTMSKVLEKLEILNACTSPDKVYEVYIEPEVGLTSEKNALWLYPIFEIGKPIQRQQHHNVMLAGLAQATTPNLPAGHSSSAPALPAGSNASTLPVS